MVKQKKKLINICMQLIAGEWWNANVVDVENQGLATGAAPQGSDAYTINGLPGDYYNCSQNRTYPINCMNTVCMRGLWTALLS